MSKTCFKHECSRKDACRHKTRLGRLPLCAKTEGKNGQKIDCRFRAPHPFGRYEFEDILMP